MSTFYFQYSIIVQQQKVQLEKMLKIFLFFVPSD